MSELDKSLREINADVLLKSPQQERQWQLFCEQHERLFVQVSKKKPDVDFTHHLLGILTKAHIETQATIENHKQAIQAMQQTMSSHLGDEEAKKFNNQSLLQLEFVTHMWLYLQGYLKMDFSLANDHAEQTALTITAVTPRDSHDLRTEFLESFYLGDQHSPLVQKRHWFWSLITKLFSPKP
ncbi:hypothetical protein [Vibrio sinaloensis]|uniref:hypothetical protein n=1 Tax=Photobacterium sp. (strain ATCC 43367) TaxID=379097 RepID=UPI00057CF470|nr:hypothetical protein [Vibrio sinaloensis]KHT51517.1 hypothetical protein RJ46_01955 [Vibrio sinaloensis]